MRSKLQKHPKSKVLKSGYINIYSKLSPQESRQIFYKTLYKTINPKWDESMVYLSKKLKKYLRGKEVLLDVGCGNGNYLIDENRSEIAWAVGIDANKNSVKKNQCLDEIVISDIENLPFKDNSFDIVLSLWVLEHLGNPKLAFSEIKRVLKKGGKFLFVTPNYKFLPLKIGKIKSMNHFLNRLLFGRIEEDVFPTFYRSNNLSQIKKLVKGKFKIIILKTNYDPSYTSFNSFSFYLTNFINSVCQTARSNITHPHIIGILEKT